MSYLLSQFAYFIGGIIGAVLSIFIIYCIAKFIQWIIFEVVYNGRRSVKFRFRITQNLLIMSVIMVLISHIPKSILPFLFLLTLAFAVYDQFRNEKRENG